MRITPFIPSSIVGNSKYLEDSIISLLLFAGLTVISLEGVLFLLFFVKNSISIPILGILAWMFYQEYQKNKATIKQEYSWQELKTSYQYWKTHLLISFGATFVIMLFSGAGGVGVQHTDYNMNNTMLDMLMRREWPIWLTSNEQMTINGIAEKRPIVYYFGYFVVPALVGKGFGWLAANIAFWLWTFVHVFISLALVLIWVVPHKDESKRIVFVVLTFLFTSGLGFIGWWVKYGLAGYKTSYLWDESVVWDLPFVFTPHWHLLLWIPHHGLGAWIATLIIVYSTSFTWVLRYVGLALGSLLIVSPFGTVGVVPFFGFIVLLSLFNQNWKKLLTPINIIGGVGIFLCSATFLTSNEFNFPILNTLKAHEGEWRPLYVWFLTFEIGFAVALYLVFLKRFNPEQKNWFLLAFITLCLIPILMMGDWNDWCARASIPAWLIVGLMLSVICYEWLKKDSIMRTIVAAVLILIMGLTPVTGDLRYSFKNYKIELPKPKQFIDYDKGTVTQQRLGKNNTFFFKYLARNTQQ